MIERTWGAGNTIVRLGMVSLAVQILLALIGVFVIPGDQVVVQWDFPSGTPTNVVAKWLGLSLAPFISALLLAAYKRSPDAFGWLRFIRIGAFILMLAIQLAIVLGNV